MTDHSLAPDLLESFDRLGFSQLSKSSPSRLPPFQLKRSRSQQGPVPPLPDDSSLTSPSTPSKAPHANNMSNSSHNKPSNLSHVPCKFFKQGTCTAGANCIFSHNPDPTSESSVCKYFLKGNCKFGTKCALLHTMSPYSADGRKLLINRSVGTGGSSTQQQQHLTTGNGRVGRFSGSPHAMEFNSGGGSGLYASARGWLEPELSSSVDRSLRDPFATSAPSQPSSFPVFEEQRRSKQQSQANIFSMDPLISGLRTASPRESDLSSSPYRPFFPHSASTSVLSSSLRGSQALHSIPESSSRYLDVPQGAYYSNGDVFDEDNLEDDEENVNDAMLPSSLNELLTPTELQQRRSREQRQHQHHQQQASYRSYHASYSPGDRMIERSTSESLLGYRQSLMMENQSSFDSLSQQHHQQQQQQQQQQQARSWQVPFYYKSNLYNDLDEGDLDQGKTNAINIPGGGSSGKTQQKASNIQELETTTDPFTQFPNHNHHHHHQTDDEGPFYMEDTEPREDDHKTMEDPHMTPFAFPSLVSLPKSS